MANLVIKLSGVASAAKVASSLQTDKRLNKSDFMRGLVEGVGPNPRLQMQIQNDDAVQASGTITISDYSKSVDGDIFQIGTKVLTAKTSGASTNQFNIGASNNATAANLAAAVNAYGAGLLIAHAAAAVVTVQAALPGTMANLIPIVLTLNDGASATSDASLASGADDTASFKDYRSF